MKPSSLRNQIRNGTLLMLAIALALGLLARRLEQFERLNVGRLVDEKNKTEAIIEHLEDGIVLIDPEGLVTHINETAAIILGVAREQALAGPFGALAGDHPHYERVLTALNGLLTQRPQAQRSKSSCTISHA